jgi:hypothetical protein
LCLLTISQAYAVRLGVKTGVNLSKASFNREVLNPDNFTRFQIGPVVEFNLPVAGLGMDIAVLYSQQGLKFDGDSKKNRSIEIPLNLKCKFNLLSIVGVYGTAGPYAGFKISGDDIPIPSISDQLKYKTFGAGLNFGFGLEIFKHLQVGANYQLALTDDYRLRDYSTKTKIWSITASLFF